MLNRSLSKVDSSLFLCPSKCYGYFVSADSVTQPIPLQHDMVTVIQHQILCILLPQLVTTSIHIYIYRCLWPISMCSFLHSSPVGIIYIKVYITCSMITDTLIVCAWIWLAMYVTPCIHKWNIIIIIIIIIFLLWLWLLLLWLWLLLLLLLLWLWLLLLLLLYLYINFVLQIFLCVCGCVSIEVCASTSRLLSPSLPTSMDTKAPCSA